MGEAFPVPKETALEIGQILFKKVECLSTV